MAKSIQVSIPHKLTADEVRTRIQNAVADAKRQYAGKFSNVQENWNGNHLDFRLTTMGQSISGMVDIDPQAVRLSVDLPWLMAMFAQKMIPQIEAEGRKLLE